VTDALHDVTTTGYDLAGNAFSRRPTRWAAVTTYHYDLAQPMVSTTDALTGFAATSTTTVAT
jgi:hypothetical protein